RSRLVKQTFHKKLQRLGEGYYRWLSRAKWRGPVFRKSSGKNRFLVAAVLGMTCSPEVFKKILDKRGGHIPATLLLPQNLLSHNDDHERIRLHLAAAFSGSGRIKIRGGHKNIVRLQIEPHGAGAP